MSNTQLAVIGISSGVINILGLVPYVRDILQHKTKPERATWWIWSALNIIAFAALVDAGATWSLCMNVGQITAVGLIAVLSLKFGYGTFHRRDAVSLILAGIGVVLWRLTHQPITALLIVIMVDMLGLWLTLNKTWKAPHTETLVSWVLASIAATMGVVAVGEINVTRLVYPAYVLLGNSLIVTLILYRRPRVVIQTEENE